MNANLDITIDEPFQKTVDEDWLREFVTQVLQVEQVDITSEVSLLVTGDETVHALNRTYRDIDGTTDVLAFALQEDKNFPSNPEGLVQLGEVIISLPQAERQAEEQEH